MPLPIVADLFGDICLLLYHPFNSFCTVWPCFLITLVDQIRREHVIQPEPMSFSFLQTETGIERMYPLLEGGMSTCDRLVRRDSFCHSLALEHWGSLFPHSRFLSRPGWGQRAGFWLFTDLRVTGEARDKASVRALLCRAMLWASWCHTSPRFTLCTRTFSRVL